MKHVLFVKNILSLIILSIFLLGCSEDKDSCLPYEGEIYDLGNPCSGIVIKVTNRDINSSWHLSNNDNTVTVVENVIGIRADPATISIDSSLIGEKFYFDFRELLPEEVHACPTFWNTPSRILYITELSILECPLTED